MLKRISIIIGLITLLALLTPACSSGTTSEIKAVIDEEFRLPIGETVVITGEGLRVKFEAVTADSRCPQGVTCIWAGEAKCQTAITLNKITDPLVFTVSGGSPSQTTFKGYTFSFNLEPYPKAQQTIDKNSYILIMKITK
jgi:hypothetical protein